MNKILFLIPTVLLLTLSGCTDLSEELYDKIDAEQYGKTEKEMDAIIGKAYASLRGGGFDGANGLAFSEYVYFLSAISSDEATLPARNNGADWYDGGRYIQLQRHTWDANNTAIAGAWSYAYNGISTINAIIFQLETSPLDEAVKQKSFMELRALRAYFYFRLLDWFGNVPIVTDYEDLELPTNAPREEVYAFVESELTEVIDSGLLPTSGYGRMTLDAANFLLMRLYLNAEVFSGQAQWEKALEVAGRIGERWEEDYFTNFLTNNEVSKEIVFAIPYDSKMGTSGNFHHWFITHQEQRWAISPTGNFMSSGGNSLVAQPGLYSAFQPADIRRNTLLVGPQYRYGTDEVITFKSGDQDLELVFTEEISSIENAGAMEGAHWNKYEFKEGEQWERDHDLVVFRYAEVLLTKAECLVRLNRTGEALPFINKVRTRANLPELSSVTLRDVENERRFEFVFEDQRRTDMIRFGSFTDTSYWSWEPPQNTAPYTILFPVPDRELAKNNRLKQNPGYPGGTADF